MYKTLTCCHSVRAFAMALFKTMDKYLSNGNPTSTYVVFRRVFGRYVGIGRTLVRPTFVAFVR